MDGAPADSERPLAQVDLRNQNLELKFYGDTKQSAKPESGLWRIQHAQPTVDPTYVWTALCASNCGGSVARQGQLHGSQRFRQRALAHQAGGISHAEAHREAGGRTWLVSDYADGYSYNWRDTEFSPPALRWRRLNIDKVVEMLGNQRREFIVGNDEWVEHPDLSRVDEVGFYRSDAGRRTDGGRSIAHRVDRSLRAPGEAVEERAPHQKTRLRSFSMVNFAVSATAITAITPACTGSVTTRSAASGTLPAIFRLMTSSPVARTSRTAVSISPPISEPARTRRGRGQPGDGTYGIG